MGGSADLFLPKKRGHVWRGLVSGLQALSVQRSEGPPETYPGQTRESLKPFVGMLLGW